MRVLIRVDAGVRLGTGHVMRCLALAQELRRTGEQVLFLQAETTPAIEHRLRAEGYEIGYLEATPGSREDARATVRSAREQGADWIVADGYHFDAEYQRHLKENELRLLLIDDYGHAEHYWSDYVLNQNLCADPMPYKNREPYTRPLVGTQYVLLRQQFAAWRNWKRNISPVVRKLLVTLGGSDPDNVTGTIIELLDLEKNRDLEWVVLIGGSNPHADSLRKQCARLPIEIRLTVDSSDVAELMAWADLAIAAGGTTSWELAFMGLPMLLVVLAENQAEIARDLESRGAALNLSHYGNLNKDSLNEALSNLCGNFGQRSLMSARARELVDGLGVRRVATRLKAANITLRRAEQKDCRLVWQWANDPVTRGVSFHQEPIAWEGHTEWFTRRLDSPRCLFYIAENGDDKPIGQIRYELDQTEAVVSVSLSPIARGTGRGAALILRGSEQCFIDSEVDTIRAYVKPENQRSARAFEVAGFKEAGEQSANNQSAQQFVLRRKAML